MKKIDISLNKRVWFRLSVKWQKQLIKSFVDFAYQGKDIVFRFIIEYSSLRGFWPPK
jgi:hypothetical protein